MERDGTGFAGRRFLLAMAAMWTVLAPAQDHGSTVFFRIVSPTTAVFTTMSVGGTVVWSSNDIGATSHIQRATVLTGTSNWTDYAHATVTGTVMSLRVLDPSPPRGMALIPAGTNAGSDPDFGAYRLTVDEFYMDRTHVTRALWEEVRAWGETNRYADLPVLSTNEMSLPVDTLNWFDAVKWCNARSEMEGRPVSYLVSGESYQTGEVDSVTCDFSAGGYRLPTIEEWEYAARSGLLGKSYPWGDSIDETRANYDFKVDHTTVAGTYPHNGYGLYDMAGNLWQWTWDWHPSYVNQYRMFCGGSWLDDGPFCRCRYRGFSQPDIRYYGFGFRTVLPQGNP